MEIETLYEDNHLLVVNKPAGILTQSDRSGDPSLLDMLKNHIKIRENKPGNVYLGMVQRLDKPVSGVLFFAKTSKAASRLSKEIRERRAVKLYLAVTENRGSIQQESRWREHKARLRRVKAKTIVVGDKEEGQESSVRSITLVQNKTCSVDLVQLITGRKHQIRAQMSHLGKPIVGDKKYGSKVAHPVNGGIGLHAILGAIKHPVRNEYVRCESSLPGYFHDYLTEMEYQNFAGKLKDELASFKKKAS